MTTTYRIDPAHSHLQFSVRHMMMANVRGTFTGVSGTVTYDDANPSASSIEATIDVSTIDTHEKTRDDHLKTEQFFNVEQYPHMTFRSTKVEKRGANDFEVMGDLTLHGVTKPVTLAVEEVSEEGKDMRGNTRIGASAKGKLKRSDFGLTWNAALDAGGVVIGDDVKLDFELEMIKV